MSFSIFFFHLMDMKMSQFNNATLLQIHKMDLGKGVEVFSSSMSIIEGIGNFDIDAHKSVEIFK